MRLAGSYHPIAYCAERLTEIISGIDAVMVLYKDDLNGIVLQIDSEQVALSDYEKVQLQEFRSGKHTSHFWMNTVNPLKLNTKSGQTTLYDEQELNVLYIAIPSYSNKSDFSDYIAISFPSNFAFSLDIKEFSALGSSEKFLLGKLISSIVRAEINRSFEEKSLLNEVRRVVKVQQDKIYELEEQKKIVLDQYLNSIGIISNQLLVEISAKYDTSFSISQDAIALLAKANLSIEQLKSSLESACSLCYHIMDDMDPITISSLHISIPKKPVVDSNEQITPNSDKAFVLLDKYEIAAEKLASSSLRVNGKNLAQALTPPVTPAAISDAIKKNARKISFLLAEHPNRWQLIREGLKGIERLDGTSHRDFKTG